MVKNCKYFRCANACGACDEYRNGACPGHGAYGYRNCGCDMCLEQTMMGDVEICEVALSLRREDMEE